MTNDILLKERALKLIQRLREQISHPGLCSRHRRRAQDFSRECRLSFTVLVILLLQKSLRSLQARLHECVRQLALGAQSSLSAGAVTQERTRPSFAGRLRQGVLPTVSGDENRQLVQRWRGHRVLGVDSSVLRLPRNEAVAQKYGWMECSNQRTLPERYAQARMSVLYDLLNELALDASLAPWKAGEEQLAYGHWDWVEPDDVVITDRGYTSYVWLLQVLAKGGQFVSRCSGSSFGPAQNLLKQDRAGVSVLATLQGCKKVRAQCRKRGLPWELKVRFVSVRLKDG